MVFIMVTSTYKSTTEPDQHEIENRSKLVKIKLWWLTQSIFHTNGTSIAYLHKWDAACVFIQIPETLHWDMITISVMDSNS